MWNKKLEQNKCLFLEKGRKVYFKMLAIEIDERDLGDIKVIQLKEIILRNKAYKDYKDFAQIFWGYNVKQTIGWNKGNGTTGKEEGTTRKREEKQVKDGIEKINRKFELQKLNL